MADAAPEVEKGSGPPAKRRRCGPTTLTFGPPSADDPTALPPDMGMLMEMPEVSGVAAAFVLWFQRAMTVPHCEVEAVFGLETEGGGGFCSGVGERFFAQRMEAVGRWAPPRVVANPEALVTDCYHSDMRTRSTSSRGAIVVETIRKPKAAPLQLRPTSRVLRIDPRQLVRFNMASEIPVPSPPVHATTTLVRLKEERSWTVHAADGDVTYVYSFCKVWQGVTRSDAEMQQRCGAGSLHVEIEFVGFLKYVRKHGIVAAVCSFLMKVIEFYGQGMCEFHVVPSPAQL